MANIIKKTFKWSKKQIIALIIAGVLVLSACIGLILFFVIGGNNSLNLIGNYMDVTNVNSSTLFVARKTSSSVNTSRPISVYADTAIVTYNDQTAFEDCEDAENVQFFVEDGTGFSEVKYYQSNNRITDANDYVNQLVIPDGWYISTYSITEKFIFVKFQYNFDGVKFQPTKFVNTMFGVYNSPLEFHTPNGGHEVVAIDRNTGLISSVVEVMQTEGYLLETPNRTSNQAGDMFVIEFNYSEGEESVANYTVGMYRGEIFIISSDEDGKLQIKRIVELDQLKVKIRIQLAEYIEDCGTDEFAVKTNKFLNSERDQIEYSFDNLNFFVDINGDVLVYFKNYPIVTNELGIQVSNRMYGAGYTINSDNTATYINSQVLGGYTIVNSEIVGEV